MRAITIFKNPAPFPFKQAALNNDSMASLKRPETPTDVRSTNEVEWKNVLRRNGTTIRVAYDESSASNSPIMYVELEKNDGTIEAYRVNLKELDIRNATKIGLIALATHKFQQDTGTLAEVSALILEAPVKGNASLSDMNRSVDTTAWMEKLRSMIPSEEYRTEERQRNLSALLDLLKNPLELYKTDSVTISKEAEEAQKKALNEALERLAEAERRKRADSAKPGDPNRAPDSQSPSRTSEAVQFLLRARTLRNMRELEDLSRVAHPQGASIRRDPL